MKFKQKSGLSLLVVMLLATTVVAEDVNENLQSLASAQHQKKSWNDRAFNRHVDLGLLQSAINKADSEAMTSAALQFLHAESILFRSHKAVTAEALFTRAMNLATEQSDAESIDRLSRAAEDAKNAKLNSLVTAAKSLAKASRGTSSVGVSPDEVSVSTFSQINKLVTRIQRMKLIGDPATRKAIEEEIAHATIPGDIKKQLMAMLMQGSGDLPFADSLSMLANSSRQIQLPPPPGHSDYFDPGPNVLPPPPPHGHVSNPALAASLPGPRPAQHQQQFQGGPKTFTPGALDLGQYPGNNAGVKNANNVPYDGPDNVHGEQRKVDLFAMGNNTGVKNANNVPYDGPDNIHGEQRKVHLGNLDFGNNPGPDSSQMDNDQLYDYLWNEDSPLGGTSRSIRSRRHVAAKLPAEFHETWDDSSFLPFVDLGLLGSAMNHGDTEQLTSCALQFLAAEQTLQRPHKAVTAESLFLRAANLAASTGDQESIQRLSKAAKSSGRDELKTVVENAAKLGGKSRSVAPAVKVSLLAHPADFARTKRITTAVNRARAIGAESTIKATRMVINGCKLDGKKALLQQLDDSTESLPHADSLKMLASVSRNWEDEQFPQEDGLQGGDLPDDFPDELRRELLGNGNDNWNGNDQEPWGNQDDTWGDQGEPYVENGGDSAWPQQGGSEGGQPWQQPGGELEPTIGNTAGQQAPGSGSSLDAASVRRFMLDGVNRIRQQNGLRPVRGNATLDRAAQMHADDMVRDNFFDHDNPSDASKRTPTDRARLAGVVNAKIAENIAGGYGIQYKGGSFQPRNGAYYQNGQQIPPHTPQTLAQELLKSWMNSPGHRANILSQNSLELGFGFTPYRENDGFPKVKAVQKFQWFQPARTQ